jgi:TldD protein
MSASSWSRLIPALATAADLAPAAALRAAGEAVEVAKVAAAINAEPIELAGEPAYGDVSWVSAYELDPLDC